MSPNSCCVFMYMHVCSFILLHTQSLNVDSPFFVQSIHFGSYYISHMNSSPSTSSDLLHDFSSSHSLPGSLVFLFYSSPPFFYPILLNYLCSFVQSMLPSFPHLLFGLEHLYLSVMWNKKLCVGAGGGWCCNENVIYSKGKLLVYFDAVDFFFQFTLDYTVHTWLRIMTNSILFRGDDFGDNQRQSMT